MLGPLTLLLVAALPASAAGAADIPAAQRQAVVEAVKTGILSSLGLDREPRPGGRATQEELRSMQRLYRETLRRMRGNASRAEGAEGAARPPAASTVLFPVTVGALKGDSRRGRRVQWYRAVFHKNPNIQAELTLARAELKISRQILSEAASAQSEVQIKVRVKPTRRPVNSDAVSHAQLPSNFSNAQEVTLDVSPKAAKWLRAGGGKRLVVDVGLDVGLDAGERDPLGPSPAVYLELGFARPGAARARRVSRSDKEVEECDEQGFCCRRSLVVSFKEIGWSDWVVAPAQYTMQLCDGACPHNYKPASMHTQVKSRLHQMTKGGTPRPCCVPASYEPMVLMHYDGRGKLKLTPFDDLIVTKCHCA